MAVAKGRRSRATWDDAAAYDRFMGRFSAVLAPQMADLAGMRPGQRVLDVGCGPGALAGELARRLGPELVTAVDLSEPFVAAVAERYPGVTALVASGEQLPFADGTFDGAFAQLALHHMDESMVALDEMIRVTCPGGVVAICDWADEEWRASNPHGPFWQAAKELLLDRMRSRLNGVEVSTLSAAVRYESFDEWWVVVAEGVGTSAGLAKSLDAESRGRLRERCRSALPEGSFTVEARSRAARGTVPP
jgi:ubiquinone/menaquinone biosynthesis C-methylase UbiE